MTDIRCPYCRNYLKQDRVDYVKEEENSFAYIIQYICENCNKKLYRTLNLTENQPKPYNGR